MSDADDTRAVRSYWIEVVLLAVVAAISHQVIPLPLIYLVPLQALLVRRGIAAFGYGAALFGIASVSFRQLTRFAGLDLPDQIASGLMRAEVVFLVLSIGGLYAIATPRFGQYRTLYRLLGATAAAGIVTAPLMGVFLELASTALESILLNLAQSTSASLDEELAADTLAGARTMAASFRAMTPGILRSYLLIYFVLLTAHWWIGTAVGARSARLPSPLRPVTLFRAPDRLVWVLVGSLAVVALERTGALDQTGLELLSAVAWNAGFVAAFVFGIQGVAIIRAFGARYGHSGTTTGLVIGVLLIIGVFALSWLLLIIAAFGASEIWVPYRQRLQAGDSERDDDVERP